MMRQADEVVYLGKSLVLLLHLLVDGVQVLGTTVYLGVFEPDSIELLAQRIHGLCEVPLPGLACLVDHLLHLLVLGGFEVEEREVLEFPLDRTHARVDWQAARRSPWSRVP